jgi:hypothetical protein
MKKIINGMLVAVTALVVSGCAGAAFNKIELVMNRNVTVGQELLDLKTAHDEGIISDSEYIQAKKDILSIMNQLGELAEKH